MIVGRILRCAALTAALLVASGPGALAASPSPYDAAVEQDAPSAFWRLESPLTAGVDERSDELGNLVGTGATGVSGPTSAGDGGVAFDGYGWVDMGDRFNFAGTAPFTVEAWFRPDAISANYEALVAKVDYFNGRRQGWQLWLTPRGPDCLEDCADTVLLERWTGGPRPDSVSGSPLSPGWHHVAVSYDGALVRLYVDGTLDGQVASSGAVAQISQPLRLGTYAPSFGQLHGSLDDVAIYERALPGYRLRAHVLAAQAPMRAPQNLLADTNAGAVDLAWDPPEDPRGLTGYRVHVERLSDASVTTSAVPADRLRLRLADLAPGLYRIRVAATTAGRGDGLSSAPALARVPEATPVQVQIPETEKAETSRPTPLASPPAIVTPAAGPSSVPTTFTGAVASPAHVSRMVLIAGGRLPVTVSGDRTGWVTVRLRRSDPHGGRAMTLAQVTGWVAAGRSAPMTLVLGAGARRALRAGPLARLSVLTTLRPADGGRPVRTTTRLR